MTETAKPDVHELRTQSRFDLEQATTTAEPPVEKRAWRPPQPSRDERPGDQR